ncbi:MAG: HAMP domain-containing sensor histidine kinase [Bacteroidota bacterium]
MKQAKFLPMFLVLLISNFVWGQKNKIALENLKNEFDSLSYIGDLKTGQNILNKAFKLIAPDDIQNLSNFNLLAANLLETTNASNDSCKKAYEKALSLAKKAGNNENIIECLGHLIDYNYGQTKEQKNNRSVIGKELNLMLKNGNNELEKAKILAHLEVYYKAEGNDNESLKSALKSLEIYKKLFEQSKVKADDLAQAYYSVSRAYRDMYQAEKQNEYLHQMRKYLSKNPDLFIIYYSFFARNLFASGKILEAQMYEDSLTNICKKQTNSNNWNNALEVNIYFTQGFVKKNDLANAYFYLKKSNVIYAKYGFEYYEGNINYTNGRVLLLAKKYIQALPFLKKGGEFAKKAGYGDLYQLCLAKTAECLEKIGDWQQAYFYSQLAGKVADSLATISTENAFIETEAKFQNKEKQQEIEIKNLQIKEANYQKYWYLGGLGTLALALGLLFWNFQTKRKASKTINDKNVVLEKLNTDLQEANQTKAKLFGIISHDLRSPISQVYQFLRLQQLNPNLLSSDQKTDLSDKIQTATGSLLETMEDLLLWSKTQMNEFNLKIQSTDIKPIIDQCVQLLKLNIEAKNLVVENKVSENISQETDPYFLQIIIRNLLQNAIKASPENCKILINFKNNELSIENSGELFTQNQYESIISSNQKQETLSGLGLKLVEELSQKIGSKISYEAVGENTCVRVKF